MTAGGKLNAVCAVCKEPQFTTLLTCDDCVNKIKQQSISIANDARAIIAEHSVSIPVGEYRIQSAFGVTKMRPSICYRVSGDSLSSPTTDHNRIEDELSKFINRPREEKLLLFAALWTYWVKHKGEFSEDRSALLEKLLSEFEVDE